MSAQPNADELTAQQRGLAEQLKQEVAHIVEVRRSAWVRFRMLWCQEPLMALLRLSLLQAHAHLKVFCNDHTYVRYLRARCARDAATSLLWLLRVHAASRAHCLPACSCAVCLTGDMGPDCRQWNLPKAVKMLTDTLHWCGTARACSTLGSSRKQHISKTAAIVCRRLEYKPHLIRWKDVVMEADTGKHFVYHANDKQGRPIVMMRPRCVGFSSGRNRLAAQRLWRLEFWCLLQQHHLRSASLQQSQ